MRVYKLSVLLLMTGCGWNINPLPQNAREAANYVCMGADMMTTERGLDRGASELNPLHDIGGYPIKAALTYLVNLVDRNGAPNLSWLGAGAQCGAAAWNEGQ